MRLATAESRRAELGAGGSPTVWTFSEKLRGLKGLNNRAQGEALGPGSLVDGGLKGREKRSIPVPMPEILVSDP